ncbi:MAG: serine protease, partial [Phenylobacterium sp.]
MKKITTAVLLLASLPVMSNADTPLSTNPHQSTLATTTNNRYIILFDEKSRIGNAATGTVSVFADGHFSSANANQLVSSVGGSVFHALPSISAIAAQLTPQQLRELKRNPQVALIEADPLRHFETESQPYGVTHVQANQLSDSHTGNIKICIPDTGIDINHEDLISGNITGEVSNTLTVEMDIGQWYEDSYGHGTHMAGTIAAVGGNNIGISGVNPGGHIKLHVVKIVDNPGWWPFRGSDLIAAVERCQAAGANIINMSISGAKSSVAEQQAMQAAFDSGILLVSASGKSGNGDYQYPASYDSVISVAATDQQQLTWQYSHDNDQIELSAPGVGLKSTTANNQYANLDGTSVAAAYVSGTAGLVWSHHPQCSNSQIRSILQQSAKDLTSTGRDNNTGFGLIQAKDAVDLIDLRGCDGNGTLNNRPTISGNPATSVDEAQLYQFSPLINDVDAGDTLTISISNKPAWASFDHANGQLSGTPADGDAGNYPNIAITVTDSNNASASTVTFGIEVINIDFPPPIEEIEQSLSQQGSDLILSNPDGSIMSVVSINDADADPTNELQTMTQSGDTVSLSHNGGSFVLIKGDKGDLGATGAAGGKGDKGDPGATGAAGGKGDKGDPGATGAAGGKGDKGDPGATGAAGGKGDPGATGAAGGKGDKGDPGATGGKGDKGDPGATGGKGDKGDPGATGGKGDKGDPGATGGKGDKGDPGATG